MADIIHTSMKNAQFLVIFHGLCILYTCLNEIWLCESIFNMIMESVESGIEE